MEPWVETTLFVLVQVFMLVGLVGLLVPIFPGIFIMWLAALVYGLVKGFGILGGGLFAVITLLMIAGVTVDNIFMGAGARRTGASWLTISLGYVAGLAGTFFFPPLGGLIAAPLVVLLLQYRQTGEWKKAWETIKGLAVGWGLSFVARLGIGLLMMGAWWLWAWRG